MNIMGGFFAQSTLSFLFAGYAVVWLIVFGYVFFLGRKQLKLEAELARLERLMNAGQH